MTLAPINSRSEDVCVLPVVITELELGDIKRHIFSAHFVERADYAAFEDRPEAFDGLGVNGADDILTARMVNSCVREIFVEDVVCGPLIGAKQADFMGNSFSDKSVKRCRLDIRDYAGDD